MQTYDEILEWLYSQVSNFQNVGQSAYKPGFDNILKLCEILDNPHKKIKTIHIAGTNGKGSTSNMVASILKEAGYSVGLFTSPHLKNFTERIRVNGEECENDYVFNFLTNIRTYFTKDFNPSFFELTTAMAFDYFTKKKVDIAVIEVGLGGRLDSTNIISPQVCAITSISLDHTELLGDTLEKIAWEKAGIIKTKIPVVIGEEKENIKNYLIDICKERNAPYIDATSINKEYISDITGIYQSQNKRTVLGIIHFLNEQGCSIKEEHIKNGFLSVKKNMHLRGRWDILQEKNPLIICDTAHNEDGFKKVTDQLSKMSFNELHMVLGFVKGKNLDKVFPLLPENANYYFVKPSIARGLPPNEYEEKIKKFFSKYKILSSAHDGLNYSKSIANENDLIFIGGSNFIISEII
ncbi:bifunctional folylpolyglutamate synthase/dihydrofolate synthase [Apibacter muscae]|uniref:bifunctional folylpolyglutamate synthase/dihydrofolate synthase n=1 Tax=Apibacter muscae TaxID=2509004 RepID=UPI0011ACF763|nr:folylpolyglutamate synthase/dihydrofolate synthase family protein [Apibacter muscae]TWP31440.1 bifunctional folylpolyglutamate synthase/dihydrofolate synthase [Apibacter muscae]